MEYHIDGGNKYNMKEIKCPNCGKVFSVDNNDYDAILKVVKNDEFHKELEEKLQQTKKQQEIEQKLSIKEKEEQYQKELNSLRLQIENLKGQVDNFSKDKELAVSEEKQRNVELLNKKDQEIIKLKSDLSNKDNEKELAISSLAKEAKDKEAFLKEQLEYYKDLKAKASTKMLGETLEIHCKESYELNLRQVLPNAYFEKDNDDRLGTKGDFIFKECSADGDEFISIMFEMKNENDQTTAKHKNEDFLKKLDKDRKDKNCEYAVLVSTLEMDSELYNSGIVDMSYKYEKMYVVRPQCFIPIITILRNAAMNSLKLKKELVEYKNQNIDISNFEANMNDFKDKFSRNYNLASEKFRKAIEDIDKSIDALQKTKQELLSSENNLRLANDKAQDLSIKKLTKNSPSLRKAFEENK